MTVAVAVGGLAFGTIRGQQQDWQDPIAFVVPRGSALLATIAIAPLMLMREAPADPAVAVPVAELHRVEHLDARDLRRAVRHVLQPGVFVQGTLGYNAAAAGIMGVPGTLFLALFSTRFGRLSAPGTGPGCS